MRLLLPKFRDHNDIKQKNPDLHRDFIFIHLEIKLFQPQFHMVTQR